MEMKKASNILAATAIFCMTATVAVAGLMDETECKRGSFTISNPYEQLDSRIVACFNYTQEVEINNHNSQERLITYLEQRVSRLESIVESLELKVDDLQRQR